MCNPVGTEIRDDQRKGASDQINERVIHQIRLIVDITGNLRLEESVRKLLRVSRNIACYHADVTIPKPFFSDKALDFRNQKTDFLRDAPGGSDDDAVSVLPIDHTVVSKQMVLHEGKRVLIFSR